MTRRLLRELLMLVLGVFFRRIEVAGLDRVPREGAVIFVLNHPNALVDPLFMLGLVPRRISMLAKSTLFHVPVLGSAMRALDVLPVYRRQDSGADTKLNRETFSSCFELLRRGGSIALFPEGISHSEPQLQPLKTGAARIALSTFATNNNAGNSSRYTAGDVQQLKIVPVGLYYTAKTTFRSNALICFGKPLTVEHVKLEADGEPPREAVQQLSTRIEAALREVTINVERRETLAIIALAERIFSSARKANAAEAVDAPESHQEDAAQLIEELHLRQLFASGYSFHNTRTPERLATLAARLQHHEMVLKKFGVDAQQLSTASLAPGAILRYLATEALPYLLLAPIAFVGALTHYPAYRLTRWCANRFARDHDDVVSTYKLLAAIILFPLTWIAILIAAYVLTDWQVALAAMIVAPLAAYVALRFQEEFARFFGGARALTLLVTRRRFVEQLRVEQREIQREISVLASEVAGR